MGRQYVKPTPYYPLKKEYEINYRNLLLGGNEGKIKYTSQGAVNPTFTTDIAGVPTEAVSFVDALSTPGGRFLLSPNTFDGTNFGGGAYIRCSIGGVMWCMDDQPLEHVSGTTYRLYYYDRHIIKSTDPAYAITVKLNGVTTTSYTLNYEKGEISITGGGASVPATMTCYYYEFSVFTSDDNYNSTYKQDGATQRVLNVENPTFDNWTSSTDVDKWTESGTVTRQTAALLGNYMTRLTAASGASSSITQTVDLSYIGMSAIPQTCFLVLARVDNYLTIEVSMDSGSTWASTNVSVSLNSTLEDKWCIYYVNSLVNSTTTPQIRITATGAGGNSCQADISCCALLQGGI